MGLFNLLDPVLDAVFNPLLKFPDVFGLLVLSLIITLIITLIYKYATDQPLLKSLKEKQKKIQAEMKKHKDNPKKVMELQKKAMESSSLMMKQSFRSMFYSFIPIIILFGWIGSHFAYMPLGVGDEFNVTLFMAGGSTDILTVAAPEEFDVLSGENITLSGEKNVKVVLKAKKQGVFEIIFVKGSQFATKEVVVGLENSYIKNIKSGKSFIDYIYGSREGFLQRGEITQIKVDYPKNKVLAWTNIPWVKNRGWLFTYIIFSIGLSIFIRKKLNVH